MGKNTWLKSDSKSDRKRRPRILAVMLGVCVLFTTYPDILAALSVFAAGEAEQPDVRYIASFTALSEEIREQTVPVGTALLELSLPDTLEAVLAEQQSSESTEDKPDDDNSSDTEQKETENKTEKDTDKETEKDTEEGKETEDSNTETRSGEDAKPEESGESEKTDETTVPDSEDASDTEDEESGERESTSTEEQGKSENEQESMPSEERQESTSTEEQGKGENEQESTPTEERQESVTIQDTYIVTMPEYYAENMIPVQTLENTQTQKQEETVTISGITWQPEPAYDANTVGTYLFTAVLPEGYALAEGISLPQIMVTVTENESGTDVMIMIQALRERIAVLPEVEEFLAAEPEVEDEDAYVAWEEKLYAYAEEAHAIWEGYEALTEEQQAQISEEELAKLTAWVELAEMFAENTMTMAAADSGHGNHTGDHTGWIELDKYTKTLAAGKNYYLADDVEAQYELTVPNGEVTLCLNGHHLTRYTTNHKAWVIMVASGATLNVYDCAGGGMMEASGTYGECGGISTEGTLNVYGGIISGKCKTSYQSEDNLVSLTYGAGIYAQAGSAVNLYGGTVQGTESSGMYVAGGAKLTVDGAAVTSRITKNPVAVAGIYIDEGAEAEVKSGTVSRDSNKYNNCTIMVCPGGSLTVSGGVISESGSRPGGICLTKYDFHTSSEAAHALISGGTVSVPVSARSGMSIKITGGSVTGGVTLYGGVLEMSESQDIQTVQNIWGGGTEAAIWISVDRLDYAFEKYARGKIKLTGALTNTEPYKVSLSDIRPSSAYPLTITEGFGSYMSGKEPSDYFACVEGYKVVLLNGEVAFVPYVMTFDANSGTCDTKTGDINGGQAMRTLPEPTKEHYNFVGWFTQKDGGEQITIDKMPKGEDITVYAHWTPKDYAITYDLAGGELQSGDENPATYNIETSEFTLKNPVRAGYSFTGWSGTGLTGEANKTVKVPKGSAGDRTYTAHWEEAKYKVTVSTYKDGALWSSGAPAVKLTADNGSSFITNLSAVGDGIYKVYSGNTDTEVSVTVNGADKTARVDYYTVTFYDGNTTLSQPASQTILKGKKAEKPSPNPAKTGHTFAKWVTTNGGSTEYNFTNTAVNAKTSLYAKWTVNTYTVTYNKNSGTIANESNYTSYTYGAGLTLPTPTRTGYTFGGWYENSSFTGNRVSSISTTATGNKTYYAKWTQDTYTISYKLNGGTVSGNPASYTVTSSTITLTNPTRTGYTFVGWSGTGLTGSNNKTVTIATGSTGNRTYTANWTVTNYTISYDLDGGVLQSGQTNPTDYTVESNAITLINPTKTGYTFTGWSGTDLTDSNNTSVTIASGSTGNRTYTANWKLADYTVILHTNGGSGGTDITSYTYGTSKTLPTNWTKTGYVFDGWYDNENCTGTAVTEISATATGDKEYWAKWTDNIAPVIGTLTYNYQPKNLWQWLVGKESLIITVPVTEEGSGADEITYTITPDGAAASAKTAAIQNGEAQITVSADFKGTISIACTDKADNTSAGVTVGAGLGADGVIIEDHAPQIAFEAENAELLPIGEYQTAPDIAVTIADDKDNAVSGGIASVSYQIEGGNVTTVAHDYTTGMVVNDSFTIPSSEILVNGAVISVTAKDNAGNSATQSYTVKVHTHSATLVPAADPTCTEAGNQAYYICSCDKYFSDSDCTQEITAQEAVLPAKGHTAVTDSAKAATCTETGFLEGSHCLVCAHVIKEQTITPALGHNFIMEHNETEHWQQCSRCDLEQSGEEHIYDNDTDTTCNTCGYQRTIEKHTHSAQRTVEAVDPTCTEAGNQAYYICSCDKYFSDSDCTQEITAQEVVLPAKGHTAATDPAKAATCTETGLSEGSHCSVCGHVIKAQTVTAASGHDFGGKYQYDTKGHWKECSRCKTADKKYNHRYDNSKDTTCNDCDYKRRIQKPDSGNKNDSEEKQPEPPGQPNLPGQPQSPGQPNSSEQLQPESQPQLPEQPQSVEQSQPAEHPQPGQPNPPKQPQSPDAPESQPEDGQEPESAATPETTEKTSGTGKEQLSVEDGVQTVAAAIDNGKLAISGESVATGNVEGMTDASTLLKLGNGAVIVTVVCAEQEYTAGVADTLAVANAVLTPEQTELVNNDETIEIRIDVSDITDKAPRQDKEVIESGIRENRKEMPGLTLGMYVDISMFIKIGEGDWNAITKADEPIEIIIGIPEKLREKDRTYLIIRAHDGVHTFMKDMDDEPDTITISTDMFSSYAIAYVEADSTWADSGQKCVLCHICPTFLGICCFVWLAVIILTIMVVVIILWKKRSKQENQGIGH